MNHNPNILKMVEKYRYRKGIVITDEKSNIFKIFKIIYFISLIWTFVFNLYFLIGNIVSLVFSEVKIKTTPAITILISTIFLVAGFIFLLKKLYIPGGIATIFSLIMGIVQYYTLLLNDIQLNGGITHFFYWRHLIPTIIVLVTCLVICYIGIKTKVLLNRDYKKITEKLYVSSSDKLTDLSDEQWQDLLDSGELFRENFEDKDNKKWW